MGLVGSARRWVVRVAPRSPWALAPGLDELRGYRRDQLRPDLLAGITGAAVAVPAGLALGELAGLSPVAGLYATMLPLLAFALFTSSRQVMVGPDGTLAVLTATTVAPLAAGSATRYAALAAALALMVGLVLLVSAALRLGFMADFLSIPILVGYFNGIAIIIIANQLGKVFGLSISATYFFRVLREFVTEAGEIHWWTAMFSLALLTLILVLKRVAPTFPGSLLAVVVAGVASVTLDLPDRGVAVVGDIPAGLPSLTAPNVSLGDVRLLALPAAGLALIAFADTIANARTYAKRNDYEVSANRELAALGAANIAAGFSRAMAISASGSRTALNDTAGGTSQVVGLVTALVVAVVAAVATPLIEPVPTAALGVVVIAAVLAMIDVGGIWRLRRVHAAEVGLALATLLGVLILGVLGGLLVAIGLSIGVYVYRSIRPHDAILGKVHDVDGYHDIDDFPSAETIPGLIVYRFDAPLFFPNAPYFKQRVQTLVAAAETPPRWFLLNAEAITYIDTTGVDTLREVRADLAGAGILLTVARAKAMLRDVFDSTGLTAEIGPDNFFPTTRTGVRAYLERAGP